MTRYALESMDRVGIYLAEPDEHETQAEWSARMAHARAVITDDLTDARTFETMTAANLHALSLSGRWRAIPVARPEPSHV